MSDHLSTDGSLGHSVLAGPDLPPNGSSTNRPARQPDLATENQALRTLAQHLLDDPQSLLKTLVDMALTLCGADTVGVMLLESAPNGEAIYRWVAIAGALKPLEQTTVPAGIRTSGPAFSDTADTIFSGTSGTTFSSTSGTAFDSVSGTTFDSASGTTFSNASGTTLCCNQPQLYSYPERYFPYLAQRQLPIVEGLLIPLCVSDRPLGKLWVISHHKTHRFDMETQRLMMSLGGFTASALQSIQQWRQQTATALRQNDEWYQQIINGSDDCIKVLDLEGRILFMSQGGQRLLGIQDMTPFLNNSWANFWEGSTQQLAIAAIQRASMGEVCTFQGDRPTLTGQPKWWDSKISPIRGATGQIERLLCISRDITERRQQEEMLQQTHHTLTQQTLQLEQANEILQGTLEELQVTEEELRQQNEELEIAHQLAEIERCRYQDLFNFAPDGYVVTDAKGIIQEANQAIAALVSVEQSYLVNTPLIAYIAQPDYPAFQNLLYQLRQAAGAEKLQTDQLSLQPHLPSAGKQAIPVAMTGTAIRDAQAQMVGVRWLIQDISARKRIEAEREQLLAKERHYASQLQGLTTAALAINSALSLTEVLQVITDQAASIIGAHQSVTSLTIDQNWRQAINAVYLSDKYAQWRDYHEPTDGSGIYACVCHLNRPLRLTQAELEAHPHWQGFGKEATNHPPMRGWLAVPLVGRNGQNIGLIQLSDKYAGEFTAADESILVQLAQMASVAVENARLYTAEQQARSLAEASREEAQAANRVKDEFLAVLSHELRSPLNPILGWSTLLLNHSLDATKTTQALTTIQRNAKLQSELIEDLLDVSRILQGKLSLNVAPIDLAVSLRAAMETVRLAAEARSINLQLAIGNLALEELADRGQTPNFQVLGDSTRLQQVIWNLLANAVKFTPEGGEVTIRLEQRDAHAYITVSDTGQGIAPDFLPYVFDYFRQANATTTRKFGGLGLGLAIVRHLVELHGGTVGVESPGEGQGATFSVRLPLMSIPLTTKQDDPALESFAGLNGIQVLVVDDEVDSREFVAFVLEQAGATVMMATAAEEALAMLTQFQPTLLLSDIGMPNMDGYMLMQQVRTLTPAQGGQIPAIALTAYAGEIDYQQAMSVGFQRHLSKPVEPTKLVEAIVSLVRRTILF